MFPAMDNYAHVVLALLRASEEAGSPGYRVVDDLFHCTVSGLESLKTAMGPALQAGTVLVPNEEWLRQRLGPRCVDWGAVLFRWGERD